MAGQAKGRYRYWSTQRPISLGTYPKPEGNKVVDIENFSRREFCKEIGREAWGYIDYEYPVPDEMLRQYEMVKGGENDDERD